MDGRSVNRLKHKKRALSGMAVMIGSGAMLAAAAALLMLPNSARAQAMGKASVDSGPVAPEGIAPPPAVISAALSPAPAPKGSAAAEAPKDSPKTATVDPPILQKPETPAVSVLPATVGATLFPPIVVQQPSAVDSAPQPTAAMQPAPMTASKYNPFKIRIEGDGYFRVISPEGRQAGVFYTRTGDFIINPDGRLALGNPGLVLDPPIALPFGTTDIQVSRGGEVVGTLEYAAKPVILGQIALVHFDNPSGLRTAREGGGALFQETTASGEAHQGFPGTPGFGTLKQGETETLEETLRLQAAARPAAAVTPSAGPSPANNIEAPQATAPTASIENEAIAPGRSRSATDSTKPTSAGGEPLKTSKDSSTGGWYSQFKGLVQLVGAMAVVIGLIFILKGLAKKFVPGAKAAGGRGVIEVLARHAISKNQAIVLVRIGSQIVALNQGKESSESVLVIHDATEVANIIGQIEGKKANSSQAGFTKLLANARVDLEEGADDEQALASMTPENLDEQLDEMAAAKRQLMELRQHVRTVRDRLPQG